MDKPLHDLRLEYTRGELRETELDADPFVQFDRWFDEAVRSGLREPNGVALATTGLDRRPSVRTVLMKGFDARGFVFYTNYESRKARELQVNPHAAVCFWWPELERQVRIDGDVSPCSAEESDLYFSTRPRPTQLGAWASPQSVAISRDELQQRLDQIAARFADRDVPRPPHWGGYRLAPLRFEFWQGRVNRMHDRIEYVRQPDQSWRIQRLAP
jgi:pyridoxamine 5'-phosphate oxidase